MATLTLYLEVESASIKSIFQRKIEAKFGIHIFNLLHVTVDRSRSALWLSLPS